MEVDLKTWEIRRLNPNFLFAFKRKRQVLLLGYPAFFCGCRVSLFQPWLTCHPERSRMIVSRSTRAEMSEQAVMVINTITHPLFVTMITFTTALSVSNILTEVQKLFAQTLKVTLERRPSRRAGNPKTARNTSRSVSRVGQAPDRAWIWSFRKGFCYFWPQK